MGETMENIDEHAYETLRARALLQGRSVRDLLNEAVQAYLARVPEGLGRSSLRALEPEPFPEGNERTSEEIDAIVYGGQRRQ